MSSDVTMDLGKCANVCHIVGLLDCCEVCV
jgi:hypothetical protein